MKRIKKALRLWALIMSFVMCAACSAKSVFSAPEKKFEVEGMQITLTEEFTQQTVENYTAAFTSRQAVVLVRKERFEDYPDFREETAEAYAELVHKENETLAPTEITRAEGVTYFEYTHQYEKEEVGHLLAVYKGSDAFWIVQFAAPQESYAMMKPIFLNCAKSVTFSKQ